MDANARLRPFLLVFAGMVLSACALMVSVPGLFDNPEPWQWWAFGVLAVLFGVLALVTRRLRPDIPRA